MQQRLSEAIGHVDDLRAWLGSNLELQKGSNAWFFRTSRLGCGSMLFMYIRPTQPHELI